MNRAEDLRTRVHDFFLANARSLGLDPATVDVEYVLNWGGFVNYSFRVRDAARSLHLKLAVEPVMRTALDRWFAIAPLLERHRAPRVLDRVEIGEDVGLLFPALDGGPPALTSEVLVAVVAAVRGLWADDGLGERLRDASARTALDCYRDTYDDRFRADLRMIASETPPFVDRAVLDFMQAEAEELWARVEKSTAFAEPVTSPIHGDLWLDNVLWVSRASWHILDWDDVAIGDPAMDLAMLLGPRAADLTPLKRLSDVGELPPDLSERLALLGRASLLDWVIDPLADWIDAVVAPELTERVRPEKQRVHEEALRLYRAMYRS